jgi:hypothetical protein
MREYDDYNDDSIRLYTPILQRVIILAAVIIAVPVLMWTITTFVRSYVARPRVPALEHVASTTPSTRVPLTAGSPSPAPPPPDQSPAPQIDTGSVSDTPNVAADMKQATGNLASLPGSSGASGATNNPSAAVQAAPPVQAPSPASAAVNGDASPASLPRPSQTQPQAPRPNDGAALSAGASSSDHGIAWPNPNATNPPDFAASRLTSPAAPPARTATTDDLPAGEPVRGPVPLPRHRPSIFAMAGSSAGTVAGPTAAGGPVPLPRVRPSDAPVEATNSVIEPGYGYRPGLDADR